MKRIEIRFISMLVIVVGIGSTFLLIWSGQTTPRVSASLVDITPVPTTVGGNTPTYFEDVEPIIEAHCMQCHRAGQIGYERYPIDTYKDVVANAEDVAYAVETHAMPPWMPGKNSPAIVHDRSLSDRDIETIVAWEEAGTPLGNIENRTILELGSTFDNTLPISPDLVVEMPVTYSPDPSLTDDYRCFLIDPHITEDMFVTGQVVMPGQPSIVHHVIIYQIPARARHQAEAKDAEDTRDGWECFGGPNLNVRGTTSTMIGGWVPGSLGGRMVNGAGVPVKAGNLIVLQMHYNTSAGIFPDRTKIALQTTTDPSTRTIRTVPIIAPVEIPCPTNADGIECQRTYALYDAESQMSDFLLNRCAKTLDDYATQDPTQATSSCDFTLPFSGDVVGIVPHMHQLGQNIIVERNPGTSQAQILIEVPTWDFHWQSFYVYEEAIHVNVGDTIRLTCTWNNGEGDQYVVWGERTQDEMCLSFLLFIQD
jgi:hypothetical protein